jgi:Polyketide cyclase / dehydrase and lipid transport
MQRFTHQNIMSNIQSKALAELSGEASVVIQAPIGQVYVALADFSRHSSWNKNIYKIWQITPGPIGVGTRFKAMEGAPPASFGRQLRALTQVMAGMLGGAKPLSEAEITVLEPGRRIDWVGVFPSRHGEFNRAEWRVELWPTDGGTRVVQHFRYLPQTANARNMLAALGDASGIARACEVNLGQLKRQLEARIRS